MTEKVIFKWALLAVILFTIADADDPTTTRTIKEQPIIISTVAQQYENPTIGQYELCSKIRNDCVNKCRLTDEICRGKCPVCPILIDRDVLVQGINDTLYRLPITSGKVNHTNIIRLTNEIRNIIESNLGNITTNNQNNINIYQNKTSNTGGKFGLGYNENGPCCHLIEPRRCKRSISGPICSHGRQRSCGSHCISRVMRAKRVVTCAEANPEECTQSVEYFPQPRRPGCEYISKWPFINCRGTSVRKSNCARCYEIPYMNVMRGQVPKSCIPCYSRNTRIHRRYQPVYQQRPTYYGFGQYPSYQPYYTPLYPPISYGQNLRNTFTIDDDDEGFDSPSLHGWKIEERKCINDDGTIVENCPVDANDEDDISQFPNEDSTDEDYDSTEGLDYDYGEEEKSQHERKHRKK